MILQVKNSAEYDQPITLHTGEAKTVAAGSAIKVNTGFDKRLISYYASLVNYNFDLTVLEATGQEVNSFEDAISRLNNFKRVSDSRKVLQDQKVFPEQQKIVAEPQSVRTEIYNPVTIDKIFNNEPIPTVKKLDTPVVTNVPKVEAKPIVVDPKIGEPIPDYSPDIPADYPDDPRAVAELKRIEQEEQEAKRAQEESDNKWYKLDDCCSDEALKKILLDEFGENTRLKSRSKIIYHIIEVADDAQLDVYELAEKFADK